MRRDFNQIMFNIRYSLQSLKPILGEIKPSKVVLVSSDKLISKLDWAVDELKKSTPFEIIQTLDGEAAKEWNVLEKLLNDFIKIGLDRKSLILALGGGSVTDLVGFASSIYQRGVPYVNIPTTLLAQVDSAIGGKTAINFSGYKNQIGSFYNSAATIIDNRFLESLKDEQMIDGVAEIIKAGLIKDITILEIIWFHGLAKLKEGSVMRELIEKAIKVKEYFVEKDPEDKDIRMILNFGHTIGHALELKYGLSHGKAVLMGTMRELKLGERLGETGMEIRSYLTKLFEKLKISFNEDQFEVDWENILHDKKTAGDKIKLPVIKRLGESVLIEVSLDKLKNN